MNSSPPPYTRKFNRYKSISHIHDLSLLTCFIRFTLTLAIIFLNNASKNVVSMVHEIISPKFKQYVNVHKMTPSVKPEGKWRSIYKSGLHDSRWNRGEMTELGDHIGNVFPAFYWFNLYIYTAVVKEFGRHKTWSDVWQSRAHPVRIQYG